MRERAAPLQVPTTGAAARVASADDGDRVTGRARRLLAAERRDEQWSARAVRAAGSVLRRIGVEESERGLFAWGSACLMLTGAAAFALMNASEALFLKRVGVAYLPVALLASSTVAA